MRVLWGAALGLLVAGVGCGGSSESSSESGDSMQSDRSAAATAPVSPEAEGDGVVRITATYSGHGCALEGPSEVPAEATYYVVVKNPTEEFMAVTVGRLREGHTYQDLLDEQGSPGVVFTPSVGSGEKEPPMPPEAAREFNETAGLADDEFGYAYSSEPGTHVVSLMDIGVTELWFCGTFLVT
jgi:hypothetical protein